MSKYRYEVVPEFCIFWVTFRGPRTASKILKGSATSTPAAQLLRRLWSPFPKKIHAENVWNWETQTKASFGGSELGQRMGHTKGKFAACIYLKRKPKMQVVRMRLAGTTSSFGVTIAGSPFPLRMVGHTPFIYTHASSKHIKCILHKSEYISCAIRIDASSML